MIAYDISVFKCIWCLDGVKVIFEQMDGAVVRALASHRCDPGSIPGPGVTCWLSLLLVLDPAPRVFLRVLRFSSHHKNQNIVLNISRCVSLAVVFDFSSFLFFKFGRLDLH